VAYEEGVAERIRAALGRRRDVEEKRMFGGLAFMVAGHMAVGVVGDELMVRVGPDAHEAALARRHARPMDFTGRPLRGFVYVAPAGFRTAAGLRGWLDMAVTFAKSMGPATARRAAASKSSRTRPARPKPVSKPSRGAAARVRRSRRS